jgi:hypothetical protein
MSDKFLEQHINIKLCVKLGGGGGGEKKPRDFKHGTYSMIKKATTKFLVETADISMTQIKLTCQNHK